MPRNQKTTSKASQHKFKKGFKTWAEKISVDLRVKIGVKPSAFLSGRVLASYLNVNIFCPKDFPEFSEDKLQLLFGSSDWSAITLKPFDNFLVIHNDGHNFVRQESNIMHEMAHILCEHKMSKIQHSELGLTMREYDSEQEAEAEWLGGCLQLPRVALYYAIQQYGLNIPAIGNKFSASEQMVKYRLGVTGLLR